MNAAEENHIGLTQYPQLPVEQSEVALCDPDTGDYSQGTASVMDWMKATVRSVPPGNGSCLSPPKDAKWKTSGEAANVL